MFGIVDVEVQHPSIICKKINIVLNGKSSRPVPFNFLSNSRLSDILDEASTQLKVVGLSRVFIPCGDEIFDLEQINDNEVVYMSFGDSFRSPDEIVGGYRIFRLIGEGGFGKVFEGIHIETGEVAAIKFLPKKNFKEISDADRVFTEIQALRKLSHPNIVKFLDVVSEKNYICVIMEYASKGDLNKYVKSKGRLSDKESRSIFQQILKAVHFCHSHSLVHRDLKLENILLDEFNVCRIADFGLADNVIAAQNTHCGTEAYLAPEVLKGLPLDPYKIDIWALGIVLYAITQGCLPFSSSLDKKGVTRFHSNCGNNSLMLVIQSMLEEIPENRATLLQVMMSPWVRGEEEIDPPPPSAPEKCLNTPSPQRSPMRSKPPPSPMSCRRAMSRGKKSIRPPITLSLSPCRKRDDGILKGWK
eukprot:GHVL01032672.1.p1 GENE.GHVL01032672.1~~GHVL01032672.1.p1  ORF type:complete len:416 (+),score=67.11 GHVL01032672.1:128-1375(+)